MNDFSSPFKESKLCLPVYLSFCSSHWRSKDCSQWSQASSAKQVMEFTFQQYEFALSTPLLVDYTPIDSSGSLDM